jgi:secondary thiamine-phosphate synthase enzyme
MKIYSENIELRTKGNTHIVDITDKCEKIIAQSGMNKGLMTVHNPGSTASLTTIEYEPNLIKDFKNALELIAPSDKTYEHAKTWHDDNGASHIRASLMGPSMSIPFQGARLVLGTWQQIVFCEFDTRPRARKVFIQLIGE